MTCAYTSSSKAWEAGSRRFGNRKGRKVGHEGLQEWYVFALKKGVDEDGVKPYLLGDRGLPYGARQEDLSRLIWEIPACDGEGLYRLCVVERSSGTASPV